MWVMYLILALAIIAALTLVFIYLGYKHNYWKYLEVPHEQPQPFLHICRAVLRLSACGDGNEQAHYQQLYQQFKGSGPFCGFYELLQPRVLVLERELIKQILIKDFSNFNDRGVYYNSQQDPLSGDLQSLCGRAWKEMRLKLEPIFSKHQMRFLYESVHAQSHKLVDSIEVVLQQQQETSLDMREVIHRYVLESLAHCVFGLDASQEQKYPFDEFRAMTELALTTCRHGCYANVLLSRYPAMGRRLRCATTSSKVQNYFLPLIADMVNQREHCSTETQDYLQLLINIRTQELSTHETEEHSSAKELKEHLVNELAAHAFVFLRSGYEPTVHTLTYVLYELAMNPAIQERLRLELDNALLEHDNELSYECVQQLKFMQQVICETVRLHPFTPYITRRTLTDYHISNQPKYTIRKDMCLIIPIHAVHTDPSYYGEPLLFKPERFTAGVKEQRGQCLWLGFGEGSRSCIGVHFALLQMSTALARLITQYKFSVDTAQPFVNCEEGVVLRVQRVSREDDGVNDLTNIDNGQTFLI